MKVKIMSKNGFKVIDLNRRKAIHQRCLNCAGWSVKAVTTCEFTDCPLYLFRSGQGKQNAKARDRSIKNYCLWCMNGQGAEVSKCVSRDCPLYPYRKSTTDRAVNALVLPKKHHIEPVLSIKGEGGYRNG